MSFKVVYGPPCSGKSTFVKETMGQSDVVFDYDRISCALTYQEEHTSDMRTYAHRFVLGMRSAYISVAKRGNHEASDVWLIVTNLTSSLQSYLDDLSPQYIRMQCSEDECLQRLEDDDTRPDKEKWADVIKKWFADNPSEDEQKENNMIPVEKRVADISELQKMKLEQGREYRMTMPVAVRALPSENEGMIVEGYATTFNDIYALYTYGNYTVEERIDPHAFDECDMSDVIMQYDHQGRVIARTRNNTLQLRIDAKGLFITADLGGTELGRQLYQEIKDGYTDRMSFGFVVGEDRMEYTQDHDSGHETCTRTILRINKLYDVSAVSIPANDMTSISARSLFDGLIAGKAEENRQREKEKLILKLLLEEI